MLYRRLVMNDLALFAAFALMPKIEVSQSQWNIMWIT